MRTTVIVAVALAAAAVLVARGPLLSAAPQDGATPSATSQDATSPRTQEAAPAPPGAVHPVSYGIGYYLAENVRQELGRDGLGADRDLLAKGFADGLQDREPLMARQEMEGLLQALHEEMQSRMVTALLQDSPEFRRLHDENLARSKAFHELFGQQEGVVTLPSGLQYKVLRTGQGATPKRDDTVVVSYTVTRLDGTVIKEGTNAEVRVDKVLPGGSEALSMMSRGAKWQLAVPPHLALGAAGRYPLVGPNESLVCILELVSIRRSP